MVGSVAVEVFQKRLHTLSDNGQQLLVGDADLWNESASSRPVTFNFVVSSRLLGPAFLILICLQVQTKICLLTPISPVSSCNSLLQTLC